MKLLSSLALLVTFCLTASTASAYDVVKTPEFNLNIFAWTQAGYGFTNLPEEPYAHGPYLGLARLGAIATYTNFGEAFIQYEGVDGQASLLDLVVQIQPFHALQLRMGQFRAPTSADIMIMGPDTSFVNRSLLASQAPTRLLGAEAQLTYDVGGSSLSLQTGWFAPNAQQKQGLEDEKGNHLSLRALWTLPVGLQIHIAYFDLLLAKNESTPSVTDPRVITERAVALDRQLDLALIYVQQGWTIYSEGLLSLDTPEGEPQAHAAYTHVLHNIDLGSGYSIEPGVRYGYKSRNDIITQRLTTGVNAYLAGGMLNATLNYEYYRTQGQNGHGAYIQFQAGF